MNGINVNGTKVNGINGLLHNSVSATKVSIENHVYPKLFKVVHKDLFNVSGDNQENNSSEKQNGEQNWEFFLNYKFDNIEDDAKAFSAKEVKESDRSDDHKTVRKGFDKDISKIEKSNGLEEHWKETVRNQSKSFPELFPKLENFKVSSPSLRSFHQSLSSLPNFSDRVDITSDQNPNSMTPPHFNTSNLNDSELEDSALYSVHDVNITHEDKSVAFVCIVRIAALLFVSLSVTLICVLGSIPEQYPDNINKLLVREDRDTTRVQENGISFVSTKFKAPTPNIKKMSSVHD